NLDSGRLFAITVTASGKQFLLYEGTDIQYGARHLKRAIDRFVVQPLSRLIATGQILNGDLIQIDHQPQSLSMTFSREEEGLPMKRHGQACRFSGGRARGIRRSVMTTVRVRRTVGAVDGGVNELAMLRNAAEYSPPRRGGVDAPSIKWIRSETARPGWRE